jgi:RNA polymerase sigma factor (sigma-70 family)
MFFESTEARRLLCRIVAGVNKDAAWQEDLLQEAMIHLWRVEEKRPEQTLSWYMQSCRFHLRDYIDLGRSIDSWKRRRQLVPFGTNVEEEGPQAEVEAAFENGVISEISARETISLLLENLTVFEREVLTCLIEGMDLQEIADKLGISRKTVANRRDRIAKAALRLGISA